MELAGALAVERTRVGGGEGVSGAKSSGLKLPGDGLPAAAAAWRLSLWRAARLPDRQGLTLVHLPYHPVPFVTIATQYIPHKVPYVELKSGRVLIT